MMRNTPSLKPREFLEEVNNLCKNGNSSENDLITLIIPASVTFSTSEYDPSKKMARFNFRYQTDKKDLTHFLQDFQPNGYPNPKYQIFN